MSTPAPTPELTTASRRLTAAWQAHDQSPTAETSAEVEAARAEHDRALREHLAASWSVAAVAPEPAPEPAPRSAPRSAALTLAERIAAHGRWRRGEPGGARFVAAWREDISDADLTSANLSGANLTGANLSGADLSGADLSGADLSGADLSGADLSGADLFGANLSGADLTGADLSGADLSGADLSGADLFGANLTSANLTSANLSGANLGPIRADVRTALDAAPNEVAGLLAAFRGGRINGTAYEGACACFVGTIAKLRHCNYRQIPGVKANPSRPLERFVGGVRAGDTPATNPVSAMMERWLVEWLGERPDEVRS